MAPDYTVTGAPVTITVDNGTNAVTALCKMAGRSVVPPGAFIVYESNPAPPPRAFKVSNRAARRAAAASERKNR